MKPRPVAPAERSVGLPDSAAPPKLGRALRAQLASDPLSQLTLGASLALAAFLLSPATSLAQTELVASWLALPFLSVIFLALLPRRDEVAEDEEKRFWRYLRIGFGWLLVVALLYKLPVDVGASPASPAAAIFNLSANLALAIYYFFLVLATECEPDRSQPPVSSRLEKLITWPAAGFFVLGFLVYFTVLPLFEPTVAESVPVRRVHLFLALDGYLVLRFGLRARLSDSHRWRLLYGAWALALGSQVIDDLLRLATSAETAPPALITLRHVFWLATSVLGVLAVRLRHSPLAHRVTTRHAAPYQGARLPAASSRTLVFALSFPTVHLLFHRLELLDAAQKPARAAVAFVWMVLLGLVALAQTRLLDRRAGEIWGEHKRFEAQLSSREDDLRLILERRRTERTLKVAEDRFERIFRACPDAVVITTEEDGLVVDANPGFERATGFEREEILGRTLADVGIRAHPEGRLELIRLLDKRGGAIETEVNFRRRSGAMRIARLLLDRVTIGGQRCLITIARDITERRRLEVEREKHAALLDNAAVAIYALDNEERISFWNRGAERLFGQKAGETLGHPASDLAAVGRRRAAIAIELWSTAILDDQGRPAGRLVIASEPESARSL